MHLAPTPRVLIQAFSGGGGFFFAYNTITNIPLMMSDQFLPDTVYVQPMEYNQRRTSMTKGPSQSNMQCVWVGLAAIAIVYIMNEQNRMRRYLPILQPVHAAAGMLTSVVKDVSARLTDTVAGVALIDGCKVFPHLKCGMVSLIDNTSNLANPREPTPESVKRKNHETLLKFVNDPRKTRACIIIFAHWCPHCHSLIDEIVNKSESIKNNGVKYLLVNGESVHSDAFKGDSAVISLQHYPTILCKVGDMGKEVKSIDEATRVALETNVEDVAIGGGGNTDPVEEAALDETIAEKTVPEDDADSEEDMFRALF